jgi:hypothetical protein
MVQKFAAQAVECLFDGVGVLRYRLLCRTRQQDNRVKEESGSFLKKGGARPAGTKKLLIVWAEPIRKSRSQNREKFFASFFQKRRPCLSLLPFTQLPCVRQNIFVDFQRDFLVIAARIQCLRNAKDRTRLESRRRVAADAVTVSMPSP